MITRVRRDRQQYGLGDFQRQKSFQRPEVPKEATASQIPPAQELVQHTRAVAGKPFSRNRSSRGIAFIPSLAANALHRPVVQVRDPMASFPMRRPRDASVHKAARVSHVVVEPGVTCASTVADSEHVANVVVNAGMLKVPFL